ncbi:TubC N-terminal docking domain-related protein [Pandoraea soli]
MSSVAQILSKADALGVRLFVRGDAVRMVGPESARAAIRPEVVAHKPEILAYLQRAANDVADVAGLPLADGPFMPWLPPATPEVVRAWQAELDAAIVELADLEHWPDETREQVLYRVERQPISTLLPDLHWFREQIEAARADQAARAALAARCWFGEGFGNRLAGTSSHKPKVKGNWK